MKDMRKSLEEVPGVSAEVLTFLGDRISETITGESAPVVVNVFGDNLDLIDAKAAEVVAVLKTIAGNKGVQDEKYKGKAWGELSGEIKTQILQDMKARYPLREAKIEVKEIPGKPGSYNAVAYLRPWLQMEELTTSLRMVARIPAKTA